MFKNRQVTVKVDRVKDEPTTETIKDPHSFEKKAAVVRSSLESLGAKMFLGVVVYILLDTRRQVEVAKVMYQPDN